MPSWDRKEILLEDRKQEGDVGSGGVGGGPGMGGLSGGSCLTSRWREPYHGVRDCPRASPHKPLTGHYRYEVEFQQSQTELSSGHGCTPSGSGDRFCTEEVVFKPSSKNCAGRSTASDGGEIRESSHRSPCLCSSGDCTWQHNFSPVTAQRSAVVPVNYMPCSSSSPIPFKTPLDKCDGTVIDGVGAGQRYDRDHCLGSIPWKPLKWTRPSSFSFSKAFRPDYEETSPEISVPQLKESPASSPVMCNLPSDDRALIKKPRLGWGQGLAKYEKQKVEGSVDVSGQNGWVQSTNSCKDFLPDSTTKFSAAPGSTSPATPTSATCSSSPACTDEKLSVMVSNAETDRIQCSESSALRLNHSSESISVNFDRLDANSIRALDLLLNDMMQPEGTCSGDSSSTKQSSLNKLLLLKKDISKELEKTESEIDLFENKLKSISCDSQTNSYDEHTFATQEVGVAHPCGKSVDVTNPLSHLSSSEKRVLASSVGLEQQGVGHTHLSEELLTDAKDIKYYSSNTVIHDIVQLDCSEGENIYSSSFLMDTCTVYNKDEQLKFLDAEPMVHSVVRVPDDACYHERSRWIDYYNKNADENDKFVDLIMSSNKDAAKRASQEFDLAMPPGIFQFNIWKSDNILQCRKNYMNIRAKLALKKHTLKFKEHFLALKYRALHHLWREDLNLLTLRKNRPKSHKRSEVNSRLPQLALQKQRSSPRSRHTLPGNLNVVPTTEIINFTSKLLSDSQLWPYRNNLKMPAQIIDESDRRYSRFNSNNGLIEDPSAFEKEKTMMNPWMQEEKNIFLEMLSRFGKDFRKISSLIPNKTTADCVEYYYKNHKSEIFTEVKRQLKLRKQRQNCHGNTYLITSGTRFHREANATSLELLGSASLIVAESNCSRRNNQKQSSKVSRRINGLLEKPNSEISGSEKEVAAADVLAGICSALSSDAMSSCVTSSIDVSEKMHFAAIDRSLTPEAAPQTIHEEDTCSDESSEEMESADWNDEEKSMFIRAFNMYGKDFLKVAHFVRTRSRDQCKIFFSKARKCLGLDVIQPGSTNRVTPMNDANEGRSGTDDACSTQSCSKIDDFTQSMLKTCCEGHANACNTAHQIEDRSCAQCEIDRPFLDEVEGKFVNKSSLLNEDNLVFKGGDISVVAETFIEVNPNNENPGNICSPAKLVAMLNGEEMKLHLHSEAAERDSQVDPGVENRPQVKIDKVSSVGDSFIFGRNSHSNGSYCNVEQNNGCLNHVSSSNLERQMPFDLLCSLPKGPHTKDGGKCKQESISRDLLAHDIYKTPFSNQIGSPLFIASRGSHILPQTLEDLKISGKMFDEKSSVSPEMVNGTSQPICSFIPEMSNEKRSGAGEYKSEKNLTQAKPADHQKIHSQEDPYVKPEDQAHRVGDLKLFGQILNHPSSQKSCSAQKGTKSTSTTDSLITWKDAAIFAPMPESSNTLTNHRVELPQRSYGFWDGNRIQTGFSSLPETAIILSKYQVSTGTSFSTNINSEFQQQIRMQSVCTEKKFMDTFPSELQNRNGFDVLPGFQQQRRMVHLGVNMVGGVSDPVAALQMHYSGRRAKILTGDLEPLTGDM